MKNYFNKYILISLFCIGYFHWGNAQQKEAVIDSLYLEDQLYLSVGYTFLTQKTSGINQTGLSGEISTGFIKDIPLNKRRNFALGIGVGYAYDVYNSNVKISQNSVGIATSYDKNRLYTHRIEVPLEIRFRTSTPTKFSFFRLYTGVKFSYLFHSTSSFKGNEQSLVLKNNSQIEKFRYGLHLAVGYGRLNLYMLYNLNPLFKKDVSPNFSQLTMGMKFYIF